MATPHRCPVCSGTGMVPNGFYTAVGVQSYTTSSTMSEKCRTCGGMGVIWDYVPQQEQQQNPNLPPRIICG